MINFLSFFAMLTLFLSACTTAQERKDQYYKTYYSPSGTESPKETVSK